VPVTGHVVFLGCQLPWQNQNIRNEFILRGIRLMACISCNG